jgi:small subunit ribosomal protein S9
MINLTNQFLIISKRKTAIAKFTIINGFGTIFINKKSIVNYFTSIPYSLYSVYNFFKIFQKQNLYSININISGGGQKAQLDTIIYGLAKFLFKLDPILYKNLVYKNFLKRDLRIKERRKYGLKKARKKKQYSKR